KLAVTRGGPNDRVDLARRFVVELRAENVIFRNDSFQRGVNHLNWRRRKNVEIEYISVEAGFENLVQQLNVTLEADALPYFVQMFLPHFVFELRIVEKKVGEFGSLLHEINLCHAFCFALELGRRNTDQ